MSSTNSAGGVPVGEEGWNEEVESRSPRPEDRHATRDFERRNRLWMEELARMQANSTSAQPGQPPHVSGCGVQPGYGSPGYGFGTTGDGFGAAGYGQPSPAYPTSPLLPASSRPESPRSEERRLWEGVEEATRRWEEATRRWEEATTRRDEERSRREEREEERLLRDKRLEMEGLKVPSRPVTSGPPPNAPRGPKASTPSSFSAPGRRATPAPPRGGAMAARDRGGSVHQGEDRSEWPAKMRKRWERNERNRRNKEVRRQKEEKEREKEKE
ncbi:MAG: hypothetical protein LQ342_004150 [Letrouitia transgressa]|nr:MAG: hypothetical protein LQ342_004150 [Letrouitia transgressa]